MKVFEVDLYEYFNVKKPENAKGILQCYLTHQTASVFNRTNC
jgi:hypothetical protein